MNDYIESMKTLFEKNGVDKIKLHPVVYVKTLSFSSHTFPIAFFLNKYLFCDKELVNNLTYNIVPKQRMPFIRYIKSLREEKLEYDFVLEPYREYLKMGKREFKEVLPILLKQIKDKNVLKKLMLFVGSDLKYFRKYKIELKKEKKKEPQGLGRWV